MIILTFLTTPFPTPGQKTRTLISVSCGAILEQLTSTRWDGMKTLFNIVPKGVRSPTISAGSVIGLTLYVSEAYQVGFCRTSGSIDLA